MSEPVTTGTLERRKVLEAIFKIWDGFNDLKTWKPMAALIVAGGMWVQHYNSSQDARRAEWMARSQARHAELTGTLSRIEARLENR